MAAHKKTLSGRHDGAKAAQSVLTLDRESSLRGFCGSAHARRLPHGEFQTDQRDLNVVEEVLRQALVTLVHTHVCEKGWAYEVRPTSGLVEPSIFSCSTTAMVMLAIEKALGTWGHHKERDGMPQYPNLKLSKDIRGQLGTLAELGLRDIAKFLNEAGKVATESSSYGTNDPLTLSYLAEICRVNRLDNEILQEPHGLLKAHVHARAKKLSAFSPHEGLIKEHGYFTDLGKMTPPRTAALNAFIPLRVVQAIRAVRLKSSNCRKFFESTLHEQLSFSSIPDSRFDPAELTFCLEGLILSNASSPGSPVDPSIFRRVLEVLSRAQAESAYWRPTKPFLSTVQGMVMFPLSVEVANSLLRSCDIFDGGNLFDTLASENLGLFRRYWQWIQARAVRFKFEGVSLVGWHSEHVNEPDVIHVWDTSQVVEFLISYRRLLQAHIGRTTLISSRLSRRPPEVSPDKPWTKIKSDFEPVTVLGRPYEIYENLDKDFVQGWRTPDKRKNYSMLLYGPPGTGKTTIARNLANALGFPLITVTVSDFLGQGGAQIEARAKSLFQVLESQSECVVLFDEIDNFLLDRDSTRYSRQDSVFQFMTPGMLTKLNDLRQAERVIFIVTTNYANRIDSAIKRVGRIDKRYLGSSTRRDCTLAHDRAGRLEIETR